MYKLRAELRVHTADVRAVAISSTGLIATASRDKTIALWRDASTEPTSQLLGHTHYVNHVVFVDDETLVSASSDKTIRVWNVESAECLRVLEGHTSTVCSVSKLASGSRVILSASWDGTARVWDVDSGRCINILATSSVAVWDAQGLADGRVVTVAADKQVRIWSNVDSTPKYETAAAVHTDVVRSVTACPSDGFTTVANDSRLVCWKSSGNAFETSVRMSDVHDGSYIYSIDSRATSERKFMFVTGGEDNAVRLTELDMSGSGAGQLTARQAIMHPGTVWSACMGPGSDVATACSDGIARIFTTDVTKQASADVQSAFEKSVSERQVNTKVIGGVDVTKLPDAESGLSQPGRKDGENKIVKAGNGKAEVYMWSEAEKRWTKVGEVVDGPTGTASLGSGSVKGKTYDFVFEVELGQGGKKEKLGYNRGENPYLAANRFIEDNDLSAEFLDQIAKFIEDQVPADALQEVGGGVSDPLTGGSRYVPGSSAGAASTRGDPLTGGSRYVPGSSAGAASTRGDPLTGGSRYVPNGGAGVPPPGALPPPRKLIPYAEGMVSYTSSEQLDKIQQKLIQLNTNLAKIDGEKALSMTEVDLFANSLLPKLKARGDVDMILDDADCAIVEKMVLWPTAHVFAVLDIARLVVCKASGGAYFFDKKNGDILNEVLQHMSAQEATGAVYIMGCRFLCNFFGVGGDAVRKNMGRILQAAGCAARCENRRARESFASLLINYAVLMVEVKAGVEEREVVIETCVALVSGGEKDEEVLYRVMLALGTVLFGDAAITRRGVELGVAKAAADCAPASARLQQVALDIATLIERVV